MTDTRPLLPTTEAGQRLLAEFIDDESGMATFDADGLADAIADIEAEAIAAEHDRLREAVGRLPSLMVGWHQGITRQQVLALFPKEEGR
jgi:hypothetical protein